MRMHDDLHAINVAEDPKRARMGDDSTKQPLTAAMSTPQNPEMYGQSMTGLVRLNNEDSLALDPAAGIAIVADGMGGHSGGEFASSIAVSAALRALYRDMRELPGDSDTGPMALLDEAMRRANQAVLNAANKNKQYLGMGSTLLATRFDHDNLTVGNIGDCRLYRYRQDQLKCLTRDHTMLAETGDRSLPPNILTRAIGIRDELVPDLYSFTTHPGDIYLLCSDGLTGPISDRRIKLTLSDFGANLEATATELFSLANDAGSPDNVTLILIKIRS